MRAAWHAGVQSHFFEKGRNRSARRPKPHPEVNGMAEKTSLEELEVELARQDEELAGALEMLEEGSGELLSPHARAARRALVEDLERICRPEPLRRNEFIFGLRA
jgi:hypothetical protein